MKTNKEYMMSLKEAFVNVPLPSSLKYTWNFGSLLGSCLLLQLATGMFLSYHYSASLEGAYASVVEISDEVWMGWLIRSMHSNGASLMFALVYLHIGRGLYYTSYRKKGVWVTGCLILILLMSTAFTGYVLPWGQMSYWGATVITNLFSSLPYGDAIVEWVWGGYSVSGPTLTRFFAFHYILPFGAFVMVMVHIIMLHEVGSANPLGVTTRSDMIQFHPWYYIKDLVGVIFVSLVMSLISLQYSDLFMDPDNWVPANPMITPSHIQPEWYFLFAYTILRSVPSKLGGVIALSMSVALLLILPFFKEGSYDAYGKRYSYVKKVVFWILVLDFVCLTLLGMVSPDESWLICLCQVLSGLYFFLLYLIMCY